MGFERPKELAQAIALLRASPRTILAGGTDLFPATTKQTLAGDILDISGIQDLRRISKSTSHVKIGSATTWSEIIGADLPASFDALKESAREIGSIQIQNSGTIGGNLCNASPAADGVPPLLVLDAEVELASAKGLRRLPLSKFILGNRKTALEAGEVLTAVLIPNEALSGRSHFVKLGARKHLVISIAMAVARLHVCEGRIKSAAISVGSCSEVAVRLPDLEEALLGLPASDALGAVNQTFLTPALSPIDDIRADKGYRIHAAVELVRRATSGVAQ